MLVPFYSKWNKNGTGALPDFGSNFTISFTAFALMAPTQGFYLCRAFSTLPAKYLGVI